MRMFVLYCLFLVIQPVFSQNSGKIQLIGSVESPDIKDVGITYCINPFKESEFNRMPYKRLSKTGDVYKEEIERVTFQVALLSIPGNRMMPVFMTPGDSISFMIRKDKDGRPLWEFFGKNAAHYNYSFQEEKAVRNWPKFYRKGEDILLHKQTARKYKDAQLAFLKDYSRKYPVSEEFYDYAQASIINRYICNLYFPLMNGQIQKEEIPDGYFDNHLRVTNSLSDLYMTALWNVHIYNYTEDIYENFESVYNHIVNDFEGEERAYLMSAMIGFCAAKNSMSYSKQLLDAIEQASCYTQDEVCLRYIEKAKLFYTLLYQQIPEDILNNTLLIEYNTRRELSLKEVLSEYEGKSVYIDFWASWCAPCKKDISESAEAKAYLKEKNIVYLYIGRNEQLKNWATTSEKYGITENQYMEVGTEKSGLTEYFKINSIPRYVLLDKDHQIFNVNAPRPIPSQREDFEAEVDLLIRYNSTKGIK